MPGFVNHRNPTMAGRKAKEERRFVSNGAGDGSFVEVGMAHTSTTSATPPATLSDKEKEPPARFSAGSSGHIGDILLPKAYQHWQNITGMVCSCWQ